MHFNYSTTVSELVQQTASEQHFMSLTFYVVDILCRLQIFQYLLLTIVIVYHTIPVLNLVSY